MRNSSKSYSVRLSNIEVDRAEVSVSNVHSAAGIIATFANLGRFHRSNQLKGTYGKKGLAHLIRQIAFFYDLTSSGAIDGNMNAIAQLWRRDEPNELTFTQMGNDGFPINLAPIEHRGTISARLQNSAPGNEESNHPHIVTLPEPIIMIRPYWLAGRFQTSAAAATTLTGIIHAYVYYQSIVISDKDYEEMAMNYNKVPTNPLGTAGQAVQP